MAATKTAGKKATVKKKAPARKKAPAGKKTPAKRKAPAGKKATVGKKAATGRKAPVRKKTVARPKAGAKRTSREQKEYLVIKISSLYWEAFGRCAELPVDPECFDRAVELGALENMRKNLKELSKFGKAFRDTEGCSKKAGRRAKLLADRARPKLKKITPDVYQEAFEHVAGGIARAAARQSASSRVGVEGMLC